MPKHERAKKWKLVSGIYVKTSGSTKLTFYHKQLQEDILGLDLLPGLRSGHCFCIDVPCKRKFHSYHINHPLGRLLLAAREA